MESMTYLYLCTKAGPSELSASIGVVHQGNASTATNV